MDSFGTGGIHRLNQLILEPTHLLGGSLQESHDFQLFAVILMDSIWRVHNQPIHEDICFDPLVLSRQVLKSYRDHVVGWKESPRLHQSIPAHSFAQGDFSKMTFDVAFRPQFSMSAAVFSHSNGDILRAWTQKSSIINPLVGEAEAALLAVSKAYHSYSCRRFFFGY